MSKWKKTLSVAVVFCMLLSVFVNMSVFADQQSGTQKGTVTVSVEKFTIGQGYIKEPAQVPFYEGDTVGMVLARLLGSGNYNGGTDSENITYLSNIKDENAGEVNIPQYNSGCSRIHYAECRRMVGGKRLYNDVRLDVYCE